MKKAPNEVDRQVGSRVRMRRLLIGLSQEKLGAALGLTFQQVQKYEKGTNRISASRLQQIAVTLGVSIEYFYEGVAQGSHESPGSGFSESAHAGYDADLLTADGLKILKAIHEIRSPAVRKRLADLVVAIARADGTAERSE